MPRGRIRQPGEGRVDREAIDAYWVARNREAEQHPRVEPNLEMPPTEQSASHVPEAPNVSPAVTEYNRLKAKWQSGETITSEEGNSPIGMQLRRDLYGSD